MDVFGDVIYVSLAMWALMFTADFNSKLALLSTPGDKTGNRRDSPVVDGRFGRIDWSYGLVGHDIIPMRLSTSRAFSRWAGVPGPTDLEIASDQRPSAAES
jgi:hypothetical protein